MIVPMDKKPDFAVWVDWNGVLVKHRKGDPVWRDGEVVIGTPVREMVSRVRRHLAKGRRFVVKSAMMSDPDPDRRAKVEKAIGDWALKHLGQRLEVTATCRPEFIETWDDKCRRVVRNEGIFADETVIQENDDGPGDSDDAGNPGQGPRGKEAQGRNTAKGKAESGSSGRGKQSEGVGSDTDRANAHFGTWSTWDEG